MGRLYEILFCGIVVAHERFKFAYHCGSGQGDSWPIVYEWSLFIFSKSLVLISNKSRGRLKEKVTLSSAWVQTRRRGRDIGLLRLNIYQLLLKTHVTRYIHNLGPLLPGNNVEVEFVCVCVCVPISDLSHSHCWWQPDWNQYDKNAWIDRALVVVQLR